MKRTTHQIGESEDNLWPRSMGGYFLNIYCSSWTVHCLLMCGTTVFLQQGGLMPIFFSNHWTVSHFKLKSVVEKVIYLPYPIWEDCVSVRGESRANEFLSPAAAAAALAGPSRTKRVFRNKREIQDCMWGAEWGIGDCSAQRWGWRTRRRTISSPSWGKQLKGTDHTTAATHSFLQK